MNLTATPRRLLRGGLLLGLLLLTSGNLAARDAVPRSGSAGTPGAGTPPIVTCRYRDEELPSGSIVRIAALQRMGLEMTGFDPDGDPISFAPIELPEGAWWTASMARDASSGSLWWRPSRTQTGTFPLRIDYTSGDSLGSFLLTVEVLAPAEMVSCVAIAPQGTTHGGTFTLAVDAPTAPGAAMILILGPEATSPLQFTGPLFGGTEALGIDPASMAVLFNGVSATPPPPYAVPFSFSTQIPPGLDGWTMSFQGFVHDQLVLFSSPVTTVAFGDPTPLGI